MTMKNKIFNAIQKGLQSALVFDDNNSTISYQKSDINNETNLPIVSLDELYDIFKNNPDDIFSYNTKDCLLLILDNGQEIPLHEYKGCGLPVFLKFFNEALKKSGNEIIIACNNDHYMSNILAWSLGSTQILSDDFLIKDKQTAINDIFGYFKWIRIMDIVHYFESIPAFKYCNDIKSPLLNYNSYLPSIGQLNFISNHLDMINYIFEYIGVAPLLLSDALWSSTECSPRGAWYLHNGNCYHDYKTLTGKVLPLFHKNEDI